MQQTEFLKALPAVIGQASQSTLGFLSLLSVILGLLAWVFFKDASIKVRSAIWAAIFGGAIAFYAASVGSAIQIGVKAAVVVPISGTVVDSKSNDPIGLAQITVAGRSENTTSDDNGTFNLQLVGTGNGQVEVRLRVTRQGYRVSDSLITAPNTSLVVQLHHDK